MDTDPTLPPTQPSAQPDPRDNLIAQIAASLDQVRQEAAQREAQHQAELHQLRCDMENSHAQKQAEQAADLQRRLDERDRATREAQKQSEREACQRHADLLQRQQEAATASHNLTQRFSQLELRAEAQSREQARMAETSQGTQMILSDILRKISELNTNAFIAGTPPNHSYPSQPPAETAPPDWDTPAQQLSTQLRNAQIQYRDRAIYDTTESHLPEESRTPLIRTFLHEFRQAKHRDPQFSDFPHYRSTDLAPDPSTINYEQVYLPLILQLTLRLAQLGAPPIPADPLFHGTLELQAAHHRNWAILRDRMSGTELDQEEADFYTQFHAMANRPPMGTDIPTWSRIILTQNPPQGSLTNYYAYRRAAFQHLLDTHNAPSYHPTPTESRQPSPTPTGRNSPTIPTDAHDLAQITGPVANHPDSTQPNRMAVTTSPDLTLKRRSRVTEERITLQTSQKETQRLERRTTRSTLMSGTAVNPKPLCCNTRCAVTRTPLPDAFCCARTGCPMHFACASPPNQEGTSTCHSCADPSPA